MLLAVLVLISCNQASNFAKAINKNAKCNELVTSTGCGNTHIDTATCTFDNVLWFCTADSSGYKDPECKKLKDIPAEK